MLHSKRDQYITCHRQHRFQRRNIKYQFFAGLGTMTSQSESAFIGFHVFILKNFFCKEMSSKNHSLVIKNLWAAIWEVVHLTLSHLFFFYFWRNFFNESFVSYFWRFVVFIGRPVKKRTESKLSRLGAVEQVCNQMWSNSYWMHSKLWRLFWNNMCQRV